MRFADDAQSQVSAQVTQANSLVQTIALANKQISTTNARRGDNALLDQRDTALTSLAQIMDIRVIDNGGGNLNVLVGSAPLVTGSTTRGVSSIQVSDPTTNSTNTQVVFADNKDDLNVTGGALGALINARDNYLTPAVETVDTLASGLISAVNSIHTQGQGLNGFSDVTGTNAVLDPTVPLNAGTPASGLDFHA